MTAFDFIELYLEYDCLWTKNGRIDSAPAAARRERLDALQEAFGLAKSNINPKVAIRYSQGMKMISRAEKLAPFNNLQYFEEGEFLYDRPYENNLKLTTKIIRKVSELRPILSDRIREKKVDLQSIFQHLMAFRKEAFQMAHQEIWVNHIGFNVARFYVEYLEGKFKNAIKEHLGEIDHVLWLLLDPGKRDIDMATLQSKFNFPTDDLAAIDQAWQDELDAW